MMKHAIVACLLPFGTHSVAQTPDQHADNRALDVAAIVRAADQFRDRCLNLSASMAVTVVGFDLHDANGHAVAAPVHGRIDWRQDGVSTFLAFRYDLADIHADVSSAGGYFLDQDYYVLPDRWVTHLVNSRQVLIQDPVQIAMPTPGAALFGYASEPDNSQLADQELNGLTADGQTIRLTFAPSIEDINTFEISVDSSLDFAPVAWRRGPLSGATSWRRATDGAVQPVEARCCSEYGREWTYEFQRFEPGTCAPIRFVDQPGTVVNDYTMNPGRQTVYRVGATTVREPIFIAGTVTLSTPSNWTVRTRLPLGATILLVISGAATAYWRRRRCAASH